MKTKIPKGRAARGVVLASLASLGLLMSTPPAFGFGGIGNDFESAYPSSNSYNNASCQLCHGSSTSTWNEYGWGLLQNGQNFAALQGLPSVNINGGTSMLDEINASAQPGWTSGANNNLYNSGGLTSSTATAPGGIGTLDPAAANLPPVADPNGPYTGAVGVNVMFDGTGSSDPDGTIDSYDWDFGDGSSGTGASPQHAYAAAGTYTVTLTVTDDAGDSDAATTSASIALANQAPTADPNGPYSGTVGIAVAFDGSGSTDPDGSIVSYDWDFGDGATGSGVNPTHAYAASGIFNVSLTVTDDMGATNTATTDATIGEGNQPPVADPNGPYTSTTGVAVAFDGTGSTDPDGTIASYDWDFGDGTTGTGVGPTHTYTSAGTYTVTLTVTDNTGVSDSASTSATISDPGVGNQPPVADPNGPYSGTVGVAVTFDGTGSTDPDGTIASYDWDFGDGNTGTGATPQHTYAAAGNYTVTLTVTDDMGSNNSASTSASIGDPGAGNQPPVADPNGPYMGVVGFNLMFNGTGSTDPDGTIASYDWDFGDGNTGTGASPQHTYAADGIYTVTLTVTDDLGATGTATTSATIDPENQTPTADPNGPYSGTPGVPVQFDGSASTDPDGTIVTYEWNFGDGNFGTGIKPTHAYTMDGIYTVILTVTDDAGATAVATTTATIGMGNQPPVADPNGPYTGHPGVPVIFDGSSSTDPDGSIVFYDWDFGDGTVVFDAGPTPSHTYMAEGTYNVTLTVTDDAGAADSAATTATIGIADVSLTRLKAPKKIDLEMGEVKKEEVKVTGGGTRVKQDATVTLSAVASPGIGVVIKPETRTAEIKPRKSKTKFRDFRAYISCDAGGAGTVEWTATIDAPANDDPTNDVQTGTTVVMCKGKKHRDDDDDEEDDEEEHDDRERHDD